MQPESSPRILMCPPDYFRIEYEINPWMNVQQGSDAVRRESNGMHFTAALSIWMLPSS